MMEVIECSDTSVTVKITNDTDKDIQCGTVFCLEMQDEETGDHTDYTFTAEFGI